MLSLKRERLVHLFSAVLFMLMVSVHEDVIEGLGVDQCRRRSGAAGVELLSSPRFITNTCSE